MASGATRHVQDKHLAQFLGFVLHILNRPPLRVEHVICIKTLRLEDRSSDFVSTSTLLQAQPVGLPSAGMPLHLTTRFSVAPVAPAHGLELRADGLSTVAGLPRLVGVARTAPAITVLVMPLRNYPSRFARLTVRRQDFAGLGHDPACRGVPNQGEVGYSGRRLRAPRTMREPFDNTADGTRRGADHLL